MKNPTPCQCLRCQDLAALALVLGALGDTFGAEMAARAITWFDGSESSEGYAETWSTPTPKVDDLGVN